MFAGSFVARALIALLVLRTWAHAEGECEYRDKTTDALNIHHGISFVLRIVKCVALF